MLVIGSKPEYFNAVWVKNEWSRYLKILKNDRSKLLVPCFKDMDAYDLPEEFSHLQAQDMGKIGFINDVVRGIKKVVSTSSEAKFVEKSEDNGETASISAPAIAPLLKRAFMFLEDRDFIRADEFCEKVLNQDPENADAYLGKLMADLKCSKQSDLQNQIKPFEGNKNYQKAIRFADEEMKAKLLKYNEEAKTFFLSTRRVIIIQRKRKFIASSETLGVFRDNKLLYKLKLGQTKEIITNIEEVMLTISRVSTFFGAVLKKSPERSVIIPSGTKNVFIEVELKSNNTLNIKVD